MKSNKVYWAIAAILGVFLIFQQLQAGQGVDAKQAQTMIKQGALFLDVREPAEYAEIHAPDAKLIPLADLIARQQEIVAYKDKPIVVICRSGHRSAKAASLLQEAGYTQVSSVKGGIKAWESEGLAVVRK